MNHPLRPRAFPSIPRHLLTWFDQHRRDLPWRLDRDPYRIWVSEVMLQQTTVAAVVPYFDRFMAAFPSIHALAAAEEQQVLKLWEGLGYYRRARHLHAAAKILVADHGSTLPDDPAVWSSLPGVGRYILGAVLSQAFDRRLPIVEANSLRVLSRLFGYRGDPREGEGKAWAWSAAEALMPEKRTGDFNQAVMELGALICTPTAPRCCECPLASGCEANRLGLSDSIPPPGRPQQKLAVREVAVLMRRRGRVLLCRRPPNADRWQNMWELPHAELQADEAAAEAAVRIARDLTGLRVTVGDEIATIRHTVTRFTITLTCHEATVHSGRFESKFYSEGRWVTAALQAALPISSPHRRLLGILEK